MLGYENYLHDFVGGMKYYETRMLFVRKYFTPAVFTGNALKMHTRGPIFKHFLPCPAMVGSNIKKGGDGWGGPPKVGIKLKMF